VIGSIDASVLAEAKKTEDSRIDRKKNETRKGLKRSSNKIGRLKY
jgi:hypothetical protein